jgi:hypothetical protein
MRRPAHDELQQRGEPLTRRHVARAAADPFDDAELVPG